MDIMFEYYGFTHGDMFAHRHPGLHTSPQILSFAWNDMSKLA